MAIDVSPRTVEDTENFTASENITNLLLTNPKIKSLNLLDSMITYKAMINIEKALTTPSRRILALSFKFSFLDTKNIFSLCKAISVDRTLVK